MTWWQVLLLAVTVPACAWLVAMSLTALSVSFTKLEMSRVDLETSQVELEASQEGLRASTALADGAEAQRDLARQELADALRRDA